MKKFTTATTDIKKRRILRVIPVLAAAGILSVVLTGCGSSDEEVQRYSWPLATASTGTTRRMRRLFMSVVAVVNFFMSFLL